MDDKIRKIMIAKRRAKASKNKYNYYKVLQVKYGDENGWEDECQYPTDSHGFVIDRKEYLEDRKAYRTDCAYPIRYINRKEKNDEIAVR